jgi:hypothetical protein
MTGARWDLLPEGADVLLVFDALSQKCNSVLIHKSLRYCYESEWCRGGVALRVGKMRFRYWGIWKRVIDLATVSRRKAGDMRNVVYWDDAMESDTGSRVYLRCMLMTWRWGCKG